MPVVPINSDFSNVSEFVNSLFDPDVRTSQPIETAITAGDLVAEFSGEIGKIPPVWLAAWQEAQGDPFDQQQFGLQATGRAGPSSFPRAATSAVDMVPQAKALVRWWNGPPIYELQGYERPDLGRGLGLSTVVSLPFLILVGAHFRRRATGCGPAAGWERPWSPMWPSATGRSPNGERHDPGNSHYPSILPVNLCGYYFPRSIRTRPRPTRRHSSVLARGAHSPDGVVVVQRFGLQLVLPARGLAGQDHPPQRRFSDLQRDLVEHLDYGACVYSEKRGTAIFRADGLGPLAKRSTIMPPYVAVDPIQSW